MAVTITAERAKELAAGLYGEVSAKNFARYTVPFFFGRESSDGTVIARNGSAFFVRTPKATFGVTANHVVKGCLEAIDKGGFTCGLFPVNYSTNAAGLVEIGNLADRIIDRNEDRDIATFQITDKELKHLEVLVASHWPLIPPLPGKGVGFCGFPSDRRVHDRKPVSDRVPGRRDIVISFEPFPILAIATSISERSITYQFDWETTVQTQGFKIPPSELELGGMSGGPALAKIETGGGIEFWGPAGVIRSGNFTSDLGTGFIFASRIDNCLMETGKIEAGSIPWLHGN